MLLVVTGVLGARILGVEGRGQLAVLYLIPIVIVYLAGLGMPVALPFFIARGARASALRVARTAMLRQLAVMVPFNAAVLAVVYYDAPKTVQLAAGVSLATAPALLIFQYAMGALQGLQRFTTFNALRVASVLVTALVIGGLYLTGEGELITVTAAWGAGWVAAALAAAVLARRASRAPCAPDTSDADFRTMSRFGLRGLLGSASPMETFRPDQALVGLALSTSALGTYVVASSPSNLPRFVAQSVGMVAYPRVAAQRDPKNARRMMWRYFFIGAAASAAVTAALIFLAQWIILTFFGPAFASAVPVAHWMLVASLFVGLKRLLDDGARGSGRPALGSIGEVVSWVVLVPAELGLSLRFGVEGAAAGLALAGAAGFATLLTLLLLPERSHRRRALRPQPHSARAGSWKWVVATAVLCGAVGATIVLAPWLIVLVAFASGATALVFVLAIRAGAIDVKIQALRRSTGGLDADITRVPRALFFAGLFLSSAPTLRLGGFPAADFFFLGGLAVALLQPSTKSGEVEVRLPHLLVVSVALFALGGLASSFSAASASESLFTLGKLMFVVAAMLLLSTITLTQYKHVRAATGIWVAGVAVSAGVALIQVTVGPIIGGLVTGRATGLSAQDPNFLGGATAISLIPAVWLAMRSRSSLHALIYAGAAALIAVGLVVSGSVGSMLAVALGILIWIPWTRPGPRLLVAGLIATAAVAFTLSGPLAGTGLDPFRRLTTTTQATGSVASRVEIAKVALVRIDDNPVVGVGLGISGNGATAGLTPEGLFVHNTLIGSWFMAGLLGVVGIALVLLTIGAVGLRTLAGSRAVDERLLSAALLAAFFVLTLYSFSEFVLTQRFAWIPASLLLALRAQQTAGRRINDQRRDSWSPSPDRVPNAGG